MSMRGTWWLAVACIGLPLACGSNKPDVAPPASAGGSAGKGSISHPGGVTGTAAASGEAPGGAGGANGVVDGGATSDLPPIGDIAGAPTEPSGGAPADLPPECEPTGSWGAPVSLGSVNTPDADEHLLSITHDELTLVFSRGDQLFVADRASTAVDFARPTAQTLPDSYTYTLGLALSPDGRTLVVVAKDAKSFAEVGRQTRDGAFDGPPTTTRFAGLNDNRTFTGELFSSPVLAASNEAFFYVGRMATDVYVYLARGKNELGLGRKLDQTTLGAHDGKAKLTQSVSADGRALFVFDEALGHAVGLWSATAAAEFTQPVHFPGLESVFTNLGCSRLYGTGKVDASLDVVVETPK
jgi:hypothetical protein